MDVLIRFGFSIEEIKNMMDTNIWIDRISDQSLQNLITILENINCSKKQIKNILIANPFYLNIEEEKVLDLLSLLKEMKFTNLNLLFDSNPFLINLTREEFENLLKKKREESLSIEEIKDYINYELI